MGRTRDGRARDGRASEEARCFLARQFSNDTYFITRADKPNPEKLRDEQGGGIHGYGGV